MKITIKDLRTVCDRINRSLDLPLTPYSKTKDGYTPNANVYHLDKAYGGYALYKMCETGTGVHDVFRSGHMAKRDLYERMQAFILGMDTTNK